MKNRLFNLLFLGSLALVLSYSSVFCADASKNSVGAGNADKSSLQSDSIKESRQAGSSFEETKSVTQHILNIGGEKINYTATAGTFILKNEKENNKPLASVFYVSYTKNGGDITQRPLLFAFNGGPGSSSVWLHLGLLGPKRLVVPQNFQPAAIPVNLIDNEYSLLDMADIVLIDPVSTGYSRPAPKEDPNQFYDVEMDVESVAHFIQLYLSKNERWGSPKFVIGESYGTTRAVALANHFDNRYFSAFNGIILLSPVLRYDLVSHNSYPILSYVLALPSYTAAAFYYKKLKPGLFNNLNDAINASREFALNEYATALLKGTKLPPEERVKVAQRISELTGLKEEYLEKAHLKISGPEFSKQLLVEQEQVTGRFDVRYVGQDLYPLWNWNYFDPSLSFIAPAYSASIYQYLSKELNYKSEAVYEVLNMQVFPWRFTNCENRYLDMSDALVSIIQNYPLTKIHCCLGYYDLATPFFTTEFAINQLDIPEDLKNNLSISYYEAGHMIYNDLAALQKQKSTLSQFIQSTIAPLRNNQAQASLTK